MITFSWTYISLSYVFSTNDNCSYPYICALFGEQFQRFFAMPQRLEGLGFSKYRYFGPYPHFNECNQILKSIEAKYNQKKCFSAQ